MTGREIEELRRLLRGRSLVAFREWGYEKILKRGLNKGKHKIRKLRISKEKWYPHYWCSGCGYTYCINENELYHKKQHKSLKEAEEGVEKTKDEQCDKLGRFPNCEEMVIKGIIE